MPGNTDPVVGQFPETLLVAVAEYRSTGSSGGATLENEVELQMKRG
jgi:hypothetical protein